MNKKINEYTSDILNNFKNSGKEEIIIVCIGTDKCIGDCVAPLVGTFVSEESKNIKLYGTLDNPIHALNIDEKLNEISKRHPNAFVIGIDACLGSSEDVGEIRVRDYAISPGKGVGKKLTNVGDMSIIGIVDSSENSELFFSRSIRLSFIWNMAKTISDIIKNTYNELEKLKLNNNIAITV